MPSFSRTLSTIASALSITSLNGTFANNLTVTANITGNNATITNALTVGSITATNGSIILGTSSFTNNNILVGNSTVNTNISNTSIVVANSTSSTTIGSGYISSANTNLVGTTIIGSVFEKMTLSATTITNGSTINFDTLTQSALYYTGSIGGNFILNVRGNSSTTLDSILTTGQSVTVTILVTNSSTGYYPSSLQVDGVSQTIKYQFGNSFTQDGTTLSAFSFTIIKTASAIFTVLGSQTRYS